MGIRDHANKRTYVFPTLALHSRILGFPQPQLLELKHHLDNLKVPILHWWIADIQPVLKTRVYGKNTSLKPTNNEFIYWKLASFLRQALKILRQNAKPPLFWDPKSSEGACLQPEFHFLQYQGSLRCRIHLRDKRSQPFLGVLPGGIRSASIGFGRDSKPLKLMAGSEAEIALFLGGKEQNTSTTPAN